MFLNNIRVGYKLLILLIINALLYVLIGGIALVSADRINGQLEKVFSRDLQGKSFLLEADRDLHQALIAERTLLFVEPGSEMFAKQLESYTSNKKQADTRIGKFKALETTKEQDALVDAYFADRKKWDEVSLRLVKDRQEGKSTEELASSALQINAERFDAMRDHIDHLTEMLNQQAAQARSDAVKLFHDLIILLITLTLASVLLGAVVTWLIARNITRPLSRILEFTKRLAKNDFPPALALGRKDEIGILATSFDNMNVLLQDNLEQIEKKSEEAEGKAEEATKATHKAEEATRQAQQARSEGMYHAAQRLESIVERVNSASEKISNQSEVILQGSEVQSARVSETATAMEEMNATVLEVARNSSEATSMSQEAKDEAEKGAKVVGNSIEAIRTTQQQAEELRENMTLLGQKADAIGSVMNVINDIADQTNLLALNAAIEAARAGDAGRGFAVVADEVRKLAEKTMSATKEVGDSIQAIQDAAKSNMESTQIAVEDLGKAVDQAMESGNVLRQIVEKVDVSAQQIQSIATATEEQSATSEQINHAIEEIDRITAETSAGVNESVAALRDLAEQTHSLKMLIDELKEEGKG
ncbi:MAG: methyl-accepting chemotaxis protein [Desulfovibrio sp.]|uniref:methyl-accepting chemotaxis protein n=1 Tax=Desulfovibrio sp. 7SRBS1 TaxID=3378064 RepID=UPI003B42023C